MNVRILKYPMADMIEAEIVMPERAKIRMFRFQRGVPMLWAEVREDEARNRKRKFRLVVTGDVIGPVLEYVGSDMSADGSFELHCYEMYFS